MAMMGLQWQLAMMSAGSLHSVAAMMRDHLCWLHLYVYYHYDSGQKVEEMRDKVSCGAPHGLLIGNGNDGVAVAIGNYEC